MHGLGFPALLLLLLSGCTTRPSADASTSAQDAAAGRSDARTSSHDVAVSRTGDGYLVTEGQDSVLLYRDRVVQPEREHARGHYVHPLFGMSGEVLTEDFPDDHPHQHGLYWGWHQVYVGDRRVGDGWTQEDVEWEVQDVDVRDENGSASLRSTVVWISPNHVGDDGRREPIVEETSTIRVYPEEDAYRAIDVTIELRALVDSVRIGGSEDEKGYGGFSPRIKLPEDVRFVGPDGSVQPEVTAVDAGPWLDISATYHGRDPSGMAILQHPSNPGYPQTWILRSRHSMQNVKWPGREPVVLPQEDPIVLRYRLILHEGRSDGVPLERLHAEYASADG